MVRLFGLCLLFRSRKAARKLLQEWIQISTAKSAADAVHKKLGIHTKQKKTAEHTQLKEKLREKRTLNKVILEVGFEMMMMEEKRMCKKQKIKTNGFTSIWSMKLLAASIVANFTNILVRCWIDFQLNWTFPWAIRAAQATSFSTYYYYYYSFKQYHISFGQF